MNFQSIGSPGLWIGFIVFVIAMLAVDLGIFHRKAHVVSTREDLYKVPPQASLVVIASVLAGSILASLWVAKRESRSLPAN